jgi:hypothetical protein
VRPLKAGACVSGARPEALAQAQPCDAFTAARAHSGAGMELVKAAARQRLAAGQNELDSGLAAPGGCCRSPHRGRRGELADAVKPIKKSAGPDRRRAPNLTLPAVARAGGPR